LVFLAASFANAAEAEEEATYSGDLFSRSTLTGDWGGTRNDLAERGLTFDANLTRIEQGVAEASGNTAAAATSPSISTPKNSGCGPVGS
jgi:hypothetical protein